MEQGDQKPKRDRKPKRYVFTGVGKLHGRVSKGEIIDEVTLSELKGKLEHALETGMIKVAE